MATATTNSEKKIPVAAVVVGVVVLLGLGGGGYYLSRPAKPVAEGKATAEATAYLKNLALADVTMDATENFMHQQVVEVQGKISNQGPRKLNVIEVFCVFYGADGVEIHRERMAIARGLGPGDTRTFRLPFDTLPDGWNQAMPHLEIANIAFAN